jgi:YVTN family beta-propeller protein
MKRWVRVFSLLAGLFAAGVVRTHGGDQFEPPPFDLPEPEMPMPDDPTDPFTEGFDPNDLPLPDFPDDPPEFPFPDPIIDLPLPLPDYPDDEDPYPDLEPSLFPGELIDDFPPPPVLPTGHAVGKAQAFAAATNTVVPKMPFPRRILFRPAPAFFFPYTRPTSSPTCDPANQTRLIIPESKRNSVYFMDTCPPAFSSRLSVGTKPVNVKVTPDGRALVANSLDGTISVINLATKTVTNTISLPLVNNVRMQPNAIAVAPDGSRAYVASHVDLPGSFVFILDLNTMSFTGTSIAVGAFPAGMAITPDGTQLWVSSRGESRVDVFDTATNEIIAAFTITLSTGVAINPTGTRAYLLTGVSPGTVTVVDTSTLSFVAQIPVGNFPAAAVVTSTGRHVYVTNVLSNSISLIDAVGNKVIRTINLRGKHPLGLALVANGTFIK